MNHEINVGQVATLWRYPVKSMLGEEVTASEVAEQGLRGDRAYALIDEATGLLVSAKNPRKWARLFDCRAVLRPSSSAESQVEITLPDDRIISVEAGLANQLLSEILERPVRVESVMPTTPGLEMYTPDIEGLPDQNTTLAINTRPSSFFDDAPIHLLTTPSLASLQALAPDSQFAVQRFRPNIVIQPTITTGFVENEWIGQILAIGDHVRLQITKPTGRCVMTTMAQAELPQDLNILKTAMQHNQGNVGVYATVLQGGTICQGDAVCLE